MNSSESMPSPASADPAFYSNNLLKLAIAAGFAGLVALLVWWSFGKISMALVMASVFGAYMAMNIGANDVANNVGPAVGSKALTLVQATVIAAIFEAMGALIAGGEVVSTIKGGIIDPSMVDNAELFIWLMTSALLAGAVWLNFATWVGAPVSTTHSIVGGVLGAGIAAAGWGIANWGTMGKIAASWVISPMLGGMIAAAFLYYVKRNVLYHADLMPAARRVVPLLLGLMAFAFASYLAMKGLKQIIKVPPMIAFGAGLAAGIATWVVMRQRIAIKSAALSNDKEGVNSLFKAPLIVAAALLSFAHGSNDVANSIGPLAAIYDSVINHGITGGKAAVPFWIMLIGAAGLAIGLALYGPRLIRTVGKEITELDPTRAFCVAMSAAITVIIASQLGLPVSTTHVTIGAVFGVGFLREMLKSKYERVLDEVHAAHRADGKSNEELEQFMTAFEQSTVIGKRKMLKELKNSAKVGHHIMTKQERKSLRKGFKKDLVKRSIVLRVVAAWIITVPASGLMAAVIFIFMRGLYCDC